MWHMRLFDRDRYIPGIVGVRHALLGIGIPIGPRGRYGAKCAAQLLSLSLHIKARHYNIFYVFTLKNDKTVYY